jgi:mono/diheme cytochrome c family protein
MSRLSNLPLPAAWSLAIALGVGFNALAGDGGKSISVPLPPKYSQECAACHMAYPPGLLPADSWKRLMGGLPKHFGTDASLDPASLRELSNWLEANAGTYRKVREAPTGDRITASAWFVREHRKFDAATWKRASVGSASNCAACHTGAANGSFSEREIRIPR